jgi:hypothetical protein
MRLYLDTSALVKLYVEEEGSPVIRNSVDQARLIVTSAIAYIETRMAFVRRRQEGGLSAGDYRRIIRDLDDDWSRYLIVEVTDSIIRNGPAVFVPGWGIGVFVIGLENIDRIDLNAKRLSPSYAEAIKNYADRHTQ